MLKWLLDLFIETSRLCSLAGQYNCIMFTVLTNFFFFLLMPFVLVCVGCEENLS